MSVVHNLLLRPRTTDNGLRTTDHGLRTTDYGLRTTDYGLRTTWRPNEKLKPVISFKLGDVAGSCGSNSSPLAAVAEGRVPGRTGHVIRRVLADSNRRTGWGGLCQSVPRTPRNRGYLGAW